MTGFTGLLQTAKKAPQGKVQGPPTAPKQGGQGGEQGQPQVPPELMAERFEIENQQLRANTDALQLQNNLLAMQGQALQQAMGLSGKQTEEQAKISELIKIAEQDAVPPTVLERIANVATLGLSGAFGITQSPQGAESGQRRLLTLLQLQQQAAAHRPGEGMVSELTKGIVRGQEKLVELTAEGGKLTAQQAEQQLAIQNAVRSLYQDINTTKFSDPAVDLWLPMQNALRDSPNGIVPEERIKQAVAEATRVFSEKGNMGQLKDALVEIETEFESIRSSALAANKGLSGQQATAVEAGLRRGRDSFSFYRRDILKTLGVVQGEVTKAAKAAEEAAKPAPKTPETKIADIVARFKGEPTAEQKVAVSKAKGMAESFAKLEAERRVAERPHIVKLISGMAGIEDKAAGIVAEIISSGDVRSVSAEAFERAGYSPEEAVALRLAVNRWLGRFTSGYTGLTNRERPTSQSAFRQLTEMVRKEVIGK